MSSSVDANFTHDGLKKTAVKDLSPLVLLRPCYHDSSCSTDDDNDDDDDEALSTGTSHFQLIKQS